VSASSFTFCSRRGTASSPGFVDAIGTTSFPSEPTETSDALLTVGWPYIDCCVCGIEGVGAAAAESEANGFTARRAGDLMEDVGLDKTRAAIGDSVDEGHAGVHSGGAGAAGLTEASAGVL
jgi:hypothetical protein